MRGLSMVNSYSIIFMGWCYVRYGLPKSWLFFILLANVVISLILAAHIDSLRGRCTVPVEAELVRSGHCGVIVSIVLAGDVAGSFTGRMMSGVTVGATMSASRRTPSPLSCPCSGRSWASDARAPFGWTRPVRRTQRTGASCLQTGGTTCASTLAWLPSACWLRSRWLAAHSGELM